MSEEWDGGACVCCLICPLGCISAQACLAVTACVPVTHTQSERAGGHDTSGVKGHERLPLQCCVKCVDGSRPIMCVFAFVCVCLEAGRGGISK